MVKEEIEEEAEALGRITREANAGDWEQKELALAEKAKTSKKNWETIDFERETPLNKTTNL